MQTDELPAAVVEPGVEQALLGFARALRAAGLPVGADRARGFLAAVCLIEALDGEGVYWAGRATMTTEPDHFPIYDRVFEAWFAGEVPRLTGSNRKPEPVRMPPLGDSAGDGEGETELVRVAASAEEVLRHRDIAELSPSEKDMLFRLFALVRPQAPRRRALRRKGFHRGDLDPRRTLREELRRGGEVGPARYRRDTDRPRRVVLMLDVSGSMAPYADTLLRLAQVWVRAEPRTTEVFTVGTRLTRVTRALRLRDPDQALRAAGSEVPDWSGGTRLGEMLQAFTTRWGRRGMARGAVIVIFSDGWERGDPALLGDQVRLLRGLAHRIVWVNPHRGKAGYQPVQGGIVAVLPYIDDLVAGHSLTAFLDVVDVVRSA